ncbi:MAG TPA: hypothetical protein DEF42_13580 [Desulfosporosinus sp.]|nr:hypothetical protein [Desulfosporosinus sp.]
MWCRAGSVVRPKAKGRVQKQSSPFFLCNNILKYVGAIHELPLRVFCLVNLKLFGKTDIYINKER